MSETHVRNVAECDDNSGAIDSKVVDDHPVGLTNSTSDEQNNNVNKTTKATANNQSNNNSKDEINEEFDFSDSDLNELSDSGEDSHNEPANDSEDKVAKVVIPADNANPQTDSQSQPQSQAHDNEGTKEPQTMAGTAQSSDSMAMSQLTNIKSGGNDPAVGASNNAADAKKRNNVPANLELRESEGKDAANEPYCPITPRRIVDVDSGSDEDAHSRTDLSKTRSGIALNKSQRSAAADKDSSHANEEYYDDADEDEPEDELIVQFLGEANRIAEARLAARRQARAEAREIRMRELERQQKEQEQNADRVFDMHTASGIEPHSRSRLGAGIGSSPAVGALGVARGSSMSSRRSSEDSLEEEGRSLRDIRHELKDVEDRFRKAMIANAQLDNERASQTYQIQLLKDKLEEMEESYAQLQREHKEKSRDCNALKRNLDKINEELKLVQGQLNERDTLIAQQGLVIVAVENEDGSDANRALVSMENAQLLGSVQGSLDVRLKKFSEEKQQLMAEVQKLQEQLENHKSQGKGRGSSMNGPSGSDEDYEAQRQANKIISDYEYKLQKAEQEIASLQASLARSETQVIRYKSTAEAAEKAEAELKIERRKLQRENREATERLEEVETSNNHLLKRLDKLKNAKSALLKDL